MIFNWEFYINKYPDLQNKKIINREDAWEHWIKHGKTEKRIYVDIPILFDWKDYVINNKDIDYIQNEDEAWRHFLYYAKKEKRYIYHYSFLKQYWV
jgi:hypothetical protein